MQMHGNVCVIQMSDIFLLKIKDYFSSNKAKIITYIFIYNILKMAMIKFVLIYCSFNISKART